MTYVYRVLRDSPIAFYPMDSDPLTDVSGYSRTGSAVVSTYASTRPIVARGSSAFQYSGSARSNYPVPNLMIAGAEAKAFSLEFWFKPDVAIVGTCHMLARNNSGVFLTNTGLSFNLEMGAGNIISASYQQVESGNPYHVVAVYDGTDAYLYVNGEQVASVPITADNIAAGFADLAANLRIQSSTMTFTIENAAVYQYALSAATVESHYRWGTDYPDVATISGNNSANVYRIYDDSANLKSKFEVDTDEEWTAGAITGNLAVVNDSLTQQYDSTNSVYYAGTWTYSVFLSQETGLVLSGSRISWDANISNLDVKVSMDGGTTFNSVSNGGSAFNNLSLDAADAEMIVMITLPSGPTPIIVPKIITVAYVTKDVFGTNEDIPALVADEANATLSEYDYEPSAFNNNAGVKMAGLASGITFPADAEFGSYYALEAVVFSEANPPNARTLFVGGTSNVVVSATGQWTATNMTAVYVNGVAQALGAPFTVDNLKPNPVILVFPAVAGAIYLGNNAGGTGGYPFRVEYAATYRTAINASDAASIYGAWVGNVATKVREVNKTVLFEHIYPESGSPFRGYSYTWAITGSE